jgi:serine/threonine protein kinase
MPSGAPFDIPMSKKRMPDVIEQKRAGSSKCDEKVFANCSSQKRKCIQIETRKRLRTETTDTSSDERAYTRPYENDGGWWDHDGNWCYADDTYYDPEGVFHNSDGSVWDDDMDDDMDETLLHKTLMGETILLPSKNLVIKRSNLSLSGKRNREDPIAEAKWLRLLQTSSQHLRFPNIIDERTKGFHHEIITEYGGNDLFSVIEAGALPEVRARMLWQQLLECVSILHNEFKICHLDIKPENIVITEEDALKLIDFGQAQSLESKQKLVGLYGTAAYRAPEQTLSSCIDGRAVDMYSCGATLLVMLTGKGTFVPNSRQHRNWNRKCLNSNRDALRKMLQLRLRSINLQQRVSLVDLIENLLCVPTERLTVTEALSHPWTTGQ